MIKKHLPLIAVLLAAGLLCLGGTAFLFFTTTYPQAALDRLGLALWQATVASALAAVLLLLGWGLTLLLARIPDATRRRTLALVIYLGSFFLCVALPAIGILGVWNLFTDQSGWERLPALPAPAVQVAAAGTDIVIVRADDGNFHQCWTVQPEACWTSVEKPASPLLQDYEGELQPTDHAPRVPPPAETIDLVGIAYNRTGILYEAHYAVTSDGRVWYLNRETNNGTSAFVSGLALMVTLPLSLGTLTVLAGAGIASAARWLAGRLWRETD